MEFFLEMFWKFQMILKNTNEHMLLIYIIHKQKLLIYIVDTAILKETSYK